MANENTRSGSFGSTCRNLNERTPVCACVCVCIISDNTVCETMISTENPFTRNTNNRYTMAPIQTDRHTDRKRTGDNQFERQTEKTNKPTQHNERPRSVEGEEFNDCLSQQRKRSRFAYNARKGRRRRRRRRENNTHKNKTKTCHCQTRSPTRVCPGEKRIL